VPRFSPVHRCRLCAGSRAGRVARKAALLGADLVSARAT